MCEKPMAINSAEAKAMLDAAKSTGKKLTIGYQNRFRSDSQFIKGICDKGELGDIYLGKAFACRRRGVPIWGVFMNKELQGGDPFPLCAARGASWSACRGQWSVGVWRWFLGEAALVFCPSLTQHAH